MVRPLIGQLPLVGLFAGGGLAVGCGYFRLLGRSVRLLQDPRRRLQGLALLPVRIAAAAAFLVVAAHCGAFTLLGAFGGFLAARSLSLRLVRARVPGAVP